MRGNIYGSHRVIEPKGLLPQAAVKVDNNTKVYSNEILLDVIALQPTATAFGRLKNLCNNNVEEISAAIMEIVDNAGKFQDPVTKSGGILTGYVKEIGEDLKDSVSIKVGDKVASLVSLSMTPLKIYKINHIDLDTEQVYCDAEAILFESGIYTKLPEDLGDELSLAIMDIAGAPAQVAVNAKAGDVVVVMGAGKAGLLCLAEAKKRVAPHGKVVCIEYSQNQCEVVREMGVADIIVQANGQFPLETYEAFIQATGGELADFTINTVSVADTEVSSILVTKDSGKVFFFSMSTNFVKAALGAESVKKYVQMEVGNGFHPGHAEIALDIVRNNQKLREYLTNRYCK